MRATALLLCCAAICLCATTHAASPVDVLLEQRQEKLYYTLETLPPAVTKLIADDLPVQDALDAYAAAKDEYVKFNIVLILDKKTRAGKESAADRALAVGFFAGCLEHGNPWIKTEAVFALGNAEGAEALPAIRRRFDDDSATVVFHAVISFVEIAQQNPELTAEQRARYDVAAKAARGGNDGLNQLADLELARYISAAPY